MRDREGCAGQRSGRFGERSPVPGEQVVEGNGWVLGADEDVLDVLVGIDPVEATGRDDAVQDGEVLRAFVVARE